MSDERDAHGATEAIEQRLRRAAAALPLPPPDVRAALRAIFPSDAPLLRFEAVLAADSRSFGELVGVRSADEPTELTGWSLTYTAGSGEIVIDAWPVDDDHVDVDVQVFGLTPSPVLDVWFDGEVTRHVVADVVGHAPLGTVPYGSYSLRVADGTSEVLADVVLAQAPHTDDVE